MATRNTFETDKEIEVQMLVLRSIAADLERGNILTWESAEQALGMDRNDGRFQYLIKKWRRDLHRDQQIETWPEPTVGIRLLTHQEQVTLLPSKRAKRAARQHGLILRSIKNTDMSKLTEREVLMAHAVAEHSKQARRESKKASKSATVTSDRSILLERAMKKASEAVTPEAH